MEEWNDNMKQTNIDPILKLQNLGDAMIEAGSKNLELYTYMFTRIAYFMTGASGVLTAVAWALAPGSFWGATAGASMAVMTTGQMYGEIIKLVQTLMFIHMPISLGIIVPIFASGVTLAVYVPLIPYILFLFGAISWLISVLVLMAAAPIICFLMLWGGASQTNPLLAQEAEAFIKQIIGIFFRPTLMIIGLVTGMVLSYIAIDVLNIGFNNMINIILPKGADGSGTVQFVKASGIVVVYTFLMVSLVNMCFSTIHLLYDEAMKLASIGTVAPGIEDKYLDSTKGAVSQFAEPGAGAMKDSSASAHGAGIHQGPSKDALKDRRKKKEGGATGKEGPQA